MSDEKLHNETRPDTLIMLELSEYRCYLFGSSPENHGITWHPTKGQVPNFFWRWMQYICFGNKWVKDSK